MTLFLKFKIIFFDIISFIFSPNGQYKNNLLNTNNFGNILYTTIICYLLMFCAILVISLAFIAPLKALNIFPENPTNTNLSILTVLLLAPIFEELIFRLPLLFSKRNILISVALLTTLLNRHNIPLAIILTIFFITVIFILLTIKKHRIERLLKYFWYKHFSIVFYIIAIAFGAVHITNFHNLTIMQCFITPILVLPQIIMGIFFGYARVRYKNGLIICILMHIITNSIPTLLNL